MRSTSGIIEEQIKQQIKHNPTILLSIQTDSTYQNKNMKDNKLRL